MNPECPQQSSLKWENFNEFIAKKQKSNNHREEKKIKNKKMKEDMSIYINRTHPQSQMMLFIPW